MNHIVQDGDIELTVMAYPVNDEAPFEFNLDDRIHLLSRRNFDQEQLLQLVDSIKPSLIFCSGWSDKEYLTTIKKNRAITTVVGFDNQWEGNTKQRLMASVGKFLLPKWFDYAFVPGDPQVKFAKKVGFKDSKIKTGVYCCDYELFSGFGKKAEAGRAQNYPEKLLWVGRYIAAKNAQQLWEAFIEAKEVTQSNWELHCVGAGELYDQRLEHPSITHHGFIQPEELQELVMECGAFVLPSQFEPWGVVVHEFAASGLPMLVTSSVGAAASFLEPDGNGWMIDLSKPDDLKNNLINLMQTSHQSLLKMGKRSQELAERITPEKWVKTVKSMM
ncbi:MAG: glycosyltransferase family 4 protein [Flavobacteriales bacterium]|nr:glycosyltransferase family 4 protein [Flavobacteriales bacterium]